MNVTVTMKDGTKRKFTDRPGGSYYVNLEYVIGFVVITEEWGAKTSIPSDEIKEILQEPSRGGW
jgi:hypothetical protein